MKRNKFAAYLQSVIPFGEKERERKGSSSFVTNVVSLSANYESKKYFKRYNSKYPSL